MPTKLTGDPRHAVRVWMRSVLAERQWTAADWARAAETSATNITRMLSPGDASLPTAATLSKLARAAGSQPNLSLTLAHSGVSLRELFIHREVALNKGADRSNKTGKRIAIANDLPPTVVAIEVETDCMNAGGILPGDIIVVDMAPIRKPPKDRIVVGVQKDGTVLMGRCHPPLLVPVSTNTQRVPVELSKLKLTGVVVQLVRSL